MRNKYLDMQRKCLRQIRINARRQHFNESRFEPGAELVQETKEGNLEDKTADPCPDFQPGLIVKIVLDEPITDVKRFKVFSSFNNYVKLKTCIHNSSDFQIYLLESSQMPGRCYLRRSARLLFNCFCTVHQRCRSPISSRQENMESIRNSPRYFFPVKHKK